jgi:hypothetical protein
MFVTNHVLSGVLVGRALERRPVAAFLVGVGSHLLLDAVPHWGCDKRAEGGEQLFLTIAKWDGVLGLATMAIAATRTRPQARVATVAAMAGAVLPDLDKPFGHFFGINPFPMVVRRLHSLAQNESPNGMPNEISYGILFTAADLLVTAKARSPWHSPRGAPAVASTSPGVPEAGQRLSLEGP